MGEESDWYTVVPILLDGGGAEGGRGGRKRREEERGIESEREREKMEVRRNVGLNVGIG